VLLATRKLNDVSRLRIIMNKLDIYCTVLCTFLPQLDVRTMLTHDDPNDHHRRATKVRRHRSSNAGVAAGDSNTKTASELSCRGTEPPEGPSPTQHRVMHAFLREYCRIIRRDVTEVVNS